MTSSTLSLPHLLNPSLRLGGCGLNGDVIRAQGKSILHLHVCEADRGHKRIARGPKETQLKRDREYPAGRRANRIQVAFSGIKENNTNLIISTRDGQC